MKAIALAISICFFKKLLRQSNLIIKLDNLPRILTLKCQLRQWWKISFRQWTRLCTCIWTPCLNYLVVKNLTASTIFLFKTTDCGALSIKFDSQFTIHRLLTTNFTTNGKISPYKKSNFLIKWSRTFAISRLKIICVVLNKTKKKKKTKKTMKKALKTLKIWLILTVKAWQEDKCCLKIHSSPQRRA